MDIRLTASPVSNPSSIANRLLPYGPKRMDQVIDYLAQVYTLAPQAGLSPEWIVAQASHETDFFRSPIWNTRLNPAGIGVTDGPDHGYGYITGADAAAGQIVHMWGYVFGKTIRSSLAPYVRLDPRWDALMQSGMAGTVTTIDDLGNGRWATDPNYAAGLRRHYAALIAPDETEQPMSKPYILIVAGHRSTQDPGNPVERELTDDLAIAYTKAFRDAGYTADWFQRDLDRDSNPTMTIGSLTTVAVGCRNVLMARKEPMSIMLDLHFNGAESGVHAIPPSWSPGLGAAFSGDHGNDIEAYNTLDFRLARSIVRNIVNATGMRLWGSDGIMRERQTYVGVELRARLGMLSATVGVRTKAVRMVIEHGGTNDPRRIPDFANKCARAALEAVNDEFEVTVIPAPTPEVPAEPAYPFGLTRATIDKMFGLVAPFDPTGPVSKLWLANGEKTGRFPELVDLIQDDTGIKYFVFSSGEIIAHEPGKDVAYIDVPEAA